MIGLLVNVYNGMFSALQRWTEDWLPGLAARFVFASVLLFYFLNSVATKVGSGLGAFVPTTNAYAQILPKVMEQVGYDASKVAVFPYGIIVYAGTYAEFALPLLIVAGLFTRAASLGMLCFIAVMSYVDIFQHGVDAKTIGALFDRVPDQAIADQRLLWAFPLLYLVVRGAGAISLDALLARYWSRRGAA
jgi:putative oxidoreductase